MSKKKITDEVRAKHVFGELTLKDIIPFVSGCHSVTLVIDEDETNWSNFTIDEDVGLDLCYDFEDNQSEYSFGPDTRVKVRGNHIELESGEEIYFNRRAPIKIDILGSRKKDKS